MRSKIYAIGLPSAVTLDGVFDGGGDSPVGQQSHVIRCSGGSLAAAAA